MTKQELQLELFKFKKECEILNKISRKVKVEEEKPKMCPICANFITNYKLAYGVKTKEAGNENIKNIR